MIAIPAAYLGRQVVGIGNCSGRGTGKFAAFGLAPLPARHVAAPLVAECFANLECRVADTRWVDRYNMFVLEVVHAWRDPAVRAPRILHHDGTGSFAVAAERTRLAARAH